MERAKTIFLDIDGCIFEHTGDITNLARFGGVVLPGVLDAFRRWDLNGYNIILTTGRRESTRPDTERQLREAGIFYDQLVMGIGGGPRVLINDLKPGSDNYAAMSFNLKRNEGMEDIKI